MNAVIATRVITRTGKDLAPAAAECSGVLWSPVAEDSFIFVSEEGEVISLYKRAARVLKPTMSGQYLAIGVGPRATTKHIHRLVCETFRGPPPFPGAQVRHLDGNRLNNRLTNLAWGTARQNSDDQRRHGTTLAGERNRQAKLTREAVALMREMRGSTGLSFKKIAEQFGVTPMTAHRAITGGSWK